MQIAQEAHLNFSHRLPGFVGAHAVSELKGNQVAPPSFPGLLLVCLIGDGVVRRRDCSRD